MLRILKRNSLVNPVFRGNWIFAYSHAAFVFTWAYFIFVIVILAFMPAWCSLLFLPLILLLYDII